MRYLVTWRNAGKNYSYFISGLDNMLAVVDKVKIAGLWLVRVSRLD